MRTDPPVHRDEPAQLTGLLDDHRVTLRMKVGGSTREQLTVTHPPSPMDWEADEDWNCHHGHADLIRESIDGARGD